jgi:cyclopropane-fatty-acyl-phospholipid synthase
MSLLYPSEKTHCPFQRPHKLKQADICHTRPTRRASQLERWCRAALVRWLEPLEHGEVILNDGELTQRFGSHGQFNAEVVIHDPAFYRNVVFGGSLGAAEAYLQGLWECDDLVPLLRLLARNTQTLSRLNNTFSPIMKPLAWLNHRLSRNTVSGSRRNISAHYDLSNDFFALFLDPTMTYSSGIFETPESSLTDASLAKFERLCQLLELKPNDHLLEIGTGWGAFACFAAREYGCHVTTTTISREQHQYAREQIEKARLSNRVTLLQQDYRHLTGKFDKIVSIEMIEAVGHEYLGTFFAKCNELLCPGGKLALQAITIPEQRYKRYRRSVDFIQRYVFPGGCLPSMRALVKASTEKTPLQLTNLDDFALDYARTLELWRENFTANLPAIRELGMNERLIRTWHYYFCYCEAAFREQMIGLKQMLFVKPGQGAT